MKPTPGQPMQQSTTTTTATSDVLGEGLGEEPGAPLGALEARDGAAVPKAGRQPLDEAVYGQDDGT